MTTSGARALRLGGLGAVVLTAAVLALSLHRTGHTQGDDFALFLRQARSLFDGDPGAVVADNRFAVLNSDRPFSPIAYPWGWPLLLAPFVHFWGLDYDRLKVVQVAVFCVWLVMLHGIVRRRVGVVPATAVIAVIGTAPLFLAQTDQLLSEFSFFFVVSVVLWWSDRIRRRSTLLSAPTFDLVVLGALVVVAFNVRREGVVLLGVIAGMQLVDTALAVARPRSVTAVRTVLKTSRRSLALPYVSFTVGAAAFQLLLPTQLLADNGNSATFIDDRMSEFPATLADQLGLGNHTAIGVALLAIAAAGAVLGVRRRPDLDTQLLLLAVFSSLAVSTHLREVERYWFQVTPWVLYFATVALMEASRLVVRQRTTTLTLVALTPLVALVIAHLTVLPAKMADAARANEAGAVQSGPTHPSVAPMYVVIAEVTPPDAVIAYHPARTMTLVTDRRAFQTISSTRIARSADYFVQRRDSTFWQPDLSASDAEQLGFEAVWSDSTFVLWQVP